MSDSLTTTTATTVATKPAKAPKKLKPARKQVKPGDVEKKETPQTGKEYNIWYNKWAGGDREDSYSNKTKSQTRCNIRKDAGLTRAQTTGMQYVCLFFARGCCPYGWECEYLHTLPDPTKSIPDSSKDCFARDKFADYRDDMGGVGSFNRQNRTLYVGRIKETGNGQETEEVVRRHFKEFGEIERIRVLQYRSVAFVTYVSELHGQFAKEAMACQSLDNDEILNVRWATEDPNPVQKVAEKRRLEEMGRDAIAARMDPRIVDAMRAVRALEDGDVIADDGQLLLENGDDTADADGDAYERDAKRQKINSEEAETDDDDGDDGASTVPSSSAPPQPKGLLSADTIEGLRYFAEIKARTAPPVAKSASRPPATATLDLGGYGSDDD